MTCEAHEFLEKSLFEMKSDIKEIKDAFIGTLDKPGMKNMLYDIERRVSELEAIKKNIQALVWKTVGYSVAGSGGITIVIKLITEVFK